MIINKTGPVDIKFREQSGKIQIAIPLISVLFFTTIFKDSTLFIEDVFFTPFWYYYPVCVLFGLFSEKRVLFWVTAKSRRVYVSRTWNERKNDFYRQEVKHDKLYTLTRAFLNVKIIHNAHFLFFLTNFLVFLLNGYSLASG